MTTTTRPISLPVLGALSGIGRTMLVATVVASVAAIVLDIGLHADPTLVFVVSGGAILGRRSKSPRLPRRLASVR